MNKLEEDPVLGRFFDSPEKMAKWMVRFKFAMILWLIFVVLGISFWIWSVLN